MKKQTNIENLKALVNNNVMERVELATAGVQAYNIAEGEEYAVIVAYAKISGRYYFIDRDGRRYLASRYNRAEFVAGEMLERIANDAAAAKAAADQVEHAGAVLVCAALLPLFFAECDRRGIKVTSTGAGVDDLGRMLTRYELVRPTADQPTDTPADQPTADAVDTQTATPNRAALALAKVAEVGAKVRTLCTKCARRAAFFLSCAFVVVLALSVVFGLMSAAFPVFDALNISSGARVVCAVLLLIGPALELAINVECNALAVVARLFPGEFCTPIKFEVFSFWGRMLHA